MEERIKLRRGVSPRELDEMKIPTFNFSGEWYDAFGNPDSKGVWFIWGNSGNNKTQFVADLGKYLTNFKKVAIDNLEEGASAAMQRTWRRINMKEVTGKMLLLEKESIEHLCIRLDRRKSPDIVIVDSVQYTKMKAAQFYAMAEKYEKQKKLLIFVSQAKGDQPKGSLADAIHYHASQKIWVEGGRAYSKGRSIGPKGYYTIWPGGATDYYGDIK